MTTTSARAEQIAAFYSRHADRLRRVVAVNVHAPEQTIEDACQNAWAILLRHPEVTLEHGAVAGLATVAIRDAWRLASRARELPVGAYLPGDPEPGIASEPPANTSDPADRALVREQHAQRVNDFARLKPREREALYLKALGQQEIAALTNASFTAVNRRINEGRARLRKLARERDTQTGGGDREGEGGEDPPQAPSQSTMDIQPIIYRGRTVAACTRERIFLADALERRPPGDPELTFVLYMCAYAGDVARGELPGPYTDADAGRYARACLIPAELLERPTLDVHRAAAALGVPASELQAARHEHSTITARR